MIYTNLNINDMLNNIRQHLKNIKNKEYIKECIELHYKKGFITKKESDILHKEFIVEKIGD